MEAIAKYKVLSEKGLTYIKIFELLKDFGVSRTTLYKSIFFKYAFTIKTKGTKNKPSVKLMPIVPAVLFIISICRGKKIQELKKSIVESVLLKEIELQNFFE